MCSWPDSIARARQQTVRHRISDRPDHVGGQNARHHAATDMSDQRRMDREQRTSGHGQVPQAQRGGLGQHQVQNGVAISQVVMERDGAAALQSGRLQGGANARQAFRSPVHDTLHSHRGSHHLRVGPIGASVWRDGAVSVDVIADGSISLRVRQVFRCCITWPQLA